jgi:CelD/BcsL family acetyltransferase involved in cellulose biosynthesis
MEKKWGLRLLRFFQDGPSDYLGFLVSPGHTAVCRLLMENLYAHSESWDIILFRQMCALFIDPSSIHVGEGYRSVEINATVAPYLSYQGGWSELCESGPPQLRHINRKVKKFMREGGAIERVTGSGAEHTVEHIKNIEANSWKAGTDAARFQTVEEQRMLGQVLDAFGARNQVEVWLAIVNDLPVAYLLNFLMPERTCYYQGAYDKEYSKYSPGGVLHFHAIKSTWQEGPREYDLMVGDEPWKNDWTNDVRVLKHIAVIKRNLRGYLAFIFLLGPRWYFRRFVYARTAYSFWRQISNRIRRPGGV